MYGKSGNGDGEPRKIQTKEEEEELTSTVFEGAMYATTASALFDPSLKVENDSNGAGIRRVPVHYLQESVWSLVQKSKALNKIETKEKRALQLKDADKASKAKRVRHSHGGT